jgi:hypothetical protein
MLNGDKKTVHNTGFASGGLTCKLGALCFYSSSVLADSLVLRNPPERKARKRYWQADKTFCKTKKMDNQIEKLTKMLKLWLAKNELDGDLSFYSIEKWRQRKEPYLNNSEMVITTEGQLNFIINFNNGDALHDEFEDLLESFGYYYDLGYSWCLGIYKIDETKRQNINSSYSEKLKDERWIKKRELVKQRAEHKCEDCGEKNNGLEIHHCYYLYGYEPWEYPTSSLRCLCKTCHKNRDPIEKKHRGQLAHLTQNELETLNTLFSNGLYWFPRKELFDLIKCIGHDTELMKKSLTTLISKQRKTHD